MFKYLSAIKRTVVPDNSDLFDSNTFYPRLLKDIKKTNCELIIESPYLTTKRLDYIFPTLKVLKTKRIKIVINTKDPEELDNEYLRSEANKVIAKLLHLGVQVIYSTNHHRKVVIIDRNILYEGSLNVLSQNNSLEIMRRIKSSKLAWDMIRFTKLDNLIN